jgi:multicomponent Na+:H+ antiporter subunit G
MIDLIVAGLLIAGAAFLLLASVGVVRMPDIFARMHATTKAATLGSSFMLTAVAVHAGNAGVAVQALAVILFMYITAPVVAHMIGRAAHYVGVPLWKGTVINEFEGQNYLAGDATYSCQTEPGISQVIEGKEETHNPGCALFKPPPS